MKQQKKKQKKKPAHKLSCIKSERVARRDHNAYISTFGFYFVFIWPFVSFIHGGNEFLFIFILLYFYSLVVAVAVVAFVFWNFFYVDFHIREL